MEREDETEGFGAEGTAFWEAARAGRLVLPKCTDCGQVHWYPRALCPFCLSSALEWQESRGLGRVYAATLFRRAELPRIIAYVELDEGPRILTTVVSESSAPVCVGQRVEVHFVDDAGATDRAYPVFRPIK
ncbi:zinc ribbon domain-containing protein [Rhizobium sp. Leaf386]|uniref:Zn-ribbon domain-containing OB-fold protein n=1 Tax=Rhizobium sp. Leaf386 TaxID=1736359 RepID=UPI0009EC296C|nr:zinc ribbon domain-containing protein [Rhizobium sp. Leaf386]